MSDKEENGSDCGYNESSSSPLSELDQTDTSGEINHLPIPNDGTDIWEIDSRFLILDHKLASHSYGDLYKGTYRSQEVAIKILKTEYVNLDFQKEFSREVYILRMLIEKWWKRYLLPYTLEDNIFMGLVTGSDRISTPYPNELSEKYPNMHIYDLPYPFFIFIHTNIFPFLNLDKAHSPLPVFSIS
ncbi:hypothetical protein L1887_05726 [Cichorium endivia]|nr:hypothetical protein L1887_05726 [Cichorium endivia]